MLSGWGRRGGRRQEHDGSQADCALDLPSYRPRRGWASKRLTGPKMGPCGSSFWLSPFSSAQSWQTAFPVEVKTLATEGESA